jgi:hypothetical protein
MSQLIQGINQRDVKIAVVVGGIGLLVFLVIAFTLPFRDNLLSRLYPKQSSEAQSTGQGDINEDGTVNVFDLGIFGGNYGKTGIGPGSTAYEQYSDLNQDGTIDVFDLGIFAGLYGTTYPTTSPAPTNSPVPTNPVPSATPTPNPSPTVPIGNTIRVPQDYSSIQAAVDAASQDTTILVSSGSYSGATVNKKVVIEAETFDQQDPRNNQVSLSSSVIVEGGSWAWDQGPIIRGVSIHSGDAMVGNAPFTLEYSYITGGADGVSFEPQAGGIVRGCYVENTGDDCVDVDHQTKNIILENNYLGDCGQDGIEVRQHDDTILERVFLSIRNNRIENTGEDGLQIMDYNNFSNRQYLLERNLFLNNGTAAISIQAGSNTNASYDAAPMPEPLYAVNNTFINNGGAIVGGANTIAINNIFQGNQLDLKNVTGDSQVMYSLFAVSPVLQGSNNLDNTTMITGDPLLDGNHRPQTGSPAINAGLTQYQHTYTRSGQSYTDTVINLSPSDYSGTAPDLGVYEVE